MHRLATPDWGYVGWHYKTLHTLATSWHNRLFVRARGLENLPSRGGFAYAGNHTSWWDPLVLQLTTPRPINWLAKKEMMNNAFNRWFFFDRGGCIPVDRNSKNPDALAAAVRALHDGRIIGIFPEGKRNGGTLGPAKTGVARLAMEAGVAVVPVGIATDRFWPTTRKVPRLGEKIYLNVGEPMKLEGDPADPMAARRETDRVMAAVATLLAEAHAARDAGDAWAVPEAAIRPRRPTD